MSENRLTEIRLLGCLSWWKNCILKIPNLWTDSDQQAYTQLKEIVGWYFDNGIAQIVGDLKKTEGMDTKEILEESIHKYAKQKPTVTREEITRTVHCGRHWDDGTFDEGPVQIAFVELFEEKGVEVVEK